MPVDVSELVEVIAGSLFVAIGLAAAAAGLSARPRREVTALWFGVFCILYGVRLVARSSLVASATAWPESRFHYVDAFVTYAILVPGGLFVESLIGRGWLGISRRLWQLAGVYAAAAIVNDLVRGVPYASMWLNAPIVVTMLAIGVAHVAVGARGLRWTNEARAVAVTSGSFVFAAAYETVWRRGVFGDAFDSEPIAMLLFTVALGWFVLSRAREHTYAYVALSRELELAREIQRSLLPQQIPDVGGLRIRGNYLPMSAVAGDFYDVLTDDTRVVVIVADVSGHGVPAALVASMVKVAFAAESERYAQPGDILGGINRALTGKFERAYITACCVSLDRSGATLTYASAGHPPAMLLRRGGGIERLDQGGIVLTLMPAATYESTEVPFRGGDRLLLFSDGLLEAARPGTDDFFGDEELARVVSVSAHADDLSRAVLDAHRQWIGPGALLSDDVTLVVVEKSAELEGPAEAVSSVSRTTFT